MSTGWGATESPAPMMISSYFASPANIKYGGLGVRMENKNSEGSAPSCAKETRIRLLGLDTTSCVPSATEQGPDEEARQVYAPRSGCWTKFDWLFNWCAVDPTPNQHKWRPAWWGWRVYLRYLHPPGATRLYVELEKGTDKWTKQCVCCYISRALLIGIAAGVGVAIAIVNVA